MELMIKVFALFLVKFIPSLKAYEAEEEKEDIFAKIPCPAFLIFDNAAYLADMTIELPCNCKPEEVNDVVWFYQKYLGHMNTRVLTDFNGTKFIDSAEIGLGSDIQNRFIIRLFSLVIFRSQHSDSGHYICGTSRGEFFYGYDVDIQEARSTAISKNDLHQAVKPGEPEKTKEYNVFTSFWDWTMCDRCDVRGEQTKVGFCYFQSQFLYSRYRRKIPSVASCGSASVPRRFKKKLQMKKAEYLVRSCITTCPPPSEVLTGEKSFLEILGFSSKTPTVAIQYHMHPVGYPLILACPGARPEHAVAWDKGEERLYRAEFMVGLNKTMRIYIDQGNNLHFRVVQKDDKGTYFCWLQGKKIAGFRLGVSIRSKHLRKITDPESIYAIRALLFTYMVFTAAFVMFQALKFFWYFFTCQMCS
ncbi:Ig-like V-type domain-containing protein FAM187A [Huso huso]|uniref:Ig-like V-type domain-containing protein FAM187A n=1 Tax=Huso huso TaxID=61971 RepID=A0ABR0YC70_HUSHU